MSKKDEIISLLNTGYNVEQIVDKGFTKKYVHEVIRNYKKDIPPTVDSLQTERPVLNNASINSDLLKHENISSRIEIKNNIKQAQYTIQMLENEAREIQSFEIIVNIIYKNSSINNNAENIENNTDNSDIESGNYDPKFNPIKIYREQGIQELENSLTNLDVNELKAIVRKFLPDPRGYVYKWKECKKISDYIIERTSSIAEKGEVFFDS